ncbi:hypothetical protein [Haloarchaeobius amylolyticus]|uniref:hypothetical protein n=1 Tax=Haloarchaeobius amylolyticus TaxID=1198296 RepID=UPI0022719F4C|nr:hypothetical protein [Haloarchaeobius amylolyticus]
MTGEPEGQEETTTDATGRGWADIAVAVVAAGTYLAASQTLGTVEAIVAAVVLGGLVAVALNYTSLR